MGTSLLHKQFKKVIKDFIGGIGRVAFCTYRDFILSETRKELKVTQRMSG